MKSAIGQVSETLFVYRSYEESGVRMRLVNIVDPADPDVVIGHAVDCRVGHGDKLDGPLPTYHSQIFGSSHDQFLNAAGAYTKMLAAFITKGKLPS